MSRYRKFTTICCAAVFALGLAACGGGSDGGPTAEQQAQIDQAADLRAEIAALRALLGLDPADNLEASVEQLRDDLADLRQQQADDATEEADEARVATAKALKAAIDIGKFAGDGTTAAVITPTMIPVLDADGEAGTDETAEVDTVAITLKKGDAVGSLGSWKGTDYAGMQAATGAAAKNTGMVRVYANQGAAKAVTFASEAGEAVHSLTRAATTTSTGDYTFGADTNADPEADDNIGGFPATGTTDYDQDDTVTGTYMKASGTYKCVTATCTAAAAGTAGINLSAGWTFTPAAGATLQQADAQYLQFGWWIRKDKDGPTHADVFYRVVSSGTPALEALTTQIDNSDGSLVGKATYTGAAAGKFAISDPLRPGDDNSGHFTANAELDADFKTAASTLSGMIDGFRLNDGSDDPGWSVELQKATWNSADNKFGTNAAPNGGQTVWSIGDAKGGASGAWEAQMFDEATDDDSNVPTSVVGSFSSTIGTTHSLVGAFGATKQ